MRVPTLALILSGAFLLSGRAASPDPAPVTELEAFTKKLQDQLPRNPNENYRGNIVGQFRQLQSALKRRDYERAQMMLQNLSSYISSLPSDLQEDWNTLADQLAESIELARQQAAQSWKNDVDQLAKSVREACLSAQTTDDLDPQLVRCATLQMQRVNQDNILAQRANQKLQAIAQTLDLWSQYLDARNADNGEAASNALGQIRSSGPGAIILSAKDLKPFVIPANQLPDNLEVLMTPILEEISTVNDLPAAIEKLGKLDPSAVRNPGYLKLSPQIERLTLIQSAAKAVDEKQWETASQLLQKSTAGGEVCGRVMNVTQQLAEQLNARIAFAKLIAVVKSEPKPGESGLDYLQRAVDEHVAEKKYAALSVLMESVLNPARNVGINGIIAVPVPWRSADTAGLRAYVLAQRFEAAGDYLSAMMQYRSTMSIGQGSAIVPVDDAQASLKRLNEAHPEIQKDSSNAILQQLQIIQEQLRNLPAMRGAYPPGFPR